MPRYLAHALAIAAIMMIAGTAGCIAQPTVTVDSVKIGSLTAANTTLQVGVGITNPNSFDIPLQNVSFTVSSVEASGPRRLGAGATGPFTLFAAQTVERVVPVTLDNEALLEAALVAVRAGQDRMTFRVNGTVTGDVYDVLIVNVPFEQDRTITIQEVLDAAGVPMGEEEIVEALDVARTAVSGVVRGITVQVA